jgi:2-polyprenyl-3-methyl-5-hydroxy-6-metoxy-1,4-benzoquinol methylase
MQQMEITMQNQYFSYRDKCPACNSGILKELYQKPYDEPPISEYLKSFYSSQGGVEFKYLKNATFNLCECKECGLILQKEIPNDFLMEVLYEKWIDPKKVFKQHQKNDDLSLYTSYAQEISTIIAYLHQVPSELSFFDFGMGWGKWALMAKGFGCQSYGTELSEERIKHATSNGIQVIAWDEIPKHRFDFINTEQVFEHIPNPLNTLIYLKDALKADGILKISVPTANNITRLLKLMDWEAPRGTRKSLNPVAPLEHINYFRRNSLIKMAELAGMEEVVIPMRTQYTYTSNWYGAKRIAKNILLPIYRNILKRQNHLFFRNK